MLEIQEQNLSFKIKLIDCYFCGHVFKPKPDMHGDLTCPDCKLTETKDSLFRRLRKKYPNLHKLLNYKFTNDPYKEEGIIQQHESGYIEGPQDPYYQGI